MFNINKIGSYSQENTPLFHHKDKLLKMFYKEAAVYSVKQKKKHQNKFFFCKRVTI
jgi:hypothetical protein